MTRSRLKPLNDLLREENEARRARIQGKGPGSSDAVGLPPSSSPAPTPETDYAAIRADFEKRRTPEPSWRRNVPDGRFCVRYRYGHGNLGDVMTYTHRFATAEDRQQYIESIKGGAEILAVFEDAA